MSHRFTPLSAAIALAVASALVGGCAMQGRSSEMARADIEDASHASTDTTLTAQGDPVPDVIIQVAAAEQAVPPVQVAQADPAPVAAQPDDGMNTQVASANAAQQPPSSVYSSAPAPSAMPTSGAMPAPASADASSYESAGQAQALPPRADRN